MLGGSFVFGAALHEPADVQTVERARRVCMLALPDHDANGADRRPSGRAGGSAAPWRQPRADGAAALP